MTGAMGAAAVELRVLGPVEIQADGGLVHAGPPQQRTVLAALAVDVGVPVPLAELVDRVWDDNPPPAARAALHSCVSRIRRVLAAAGPPVTVVHRSGGYVLEAEPDRVDLHRFRRLVTAAAEPDLADAERAELLRTALRLFRGTPLADVPGQWAARVRESLRRQHVDAAVQWARVEVRRGRAEEVIGPLRDLAAVNPIAESLTAILMQALVAAGRNAEALECFAATRRQLIDEFGAEPGPELRAVHEAVLRGEPRRTAPDRRAAPAQLPADVPAFTGRTAELAELDRVLRVSSRTRPGDASTAVRIGAICGTAGVGKTALALRWAHGARAQFPDGQLYLNLRGHDDGHPVSPAEALAYSLDALGVPGQNIPVEVEARAARFRTEVDGRRMLILLDNAATVEQVRPLLPGTASCAVLVTSRDALAGLVAVHGAGRVDLDLLPADDARDLLRRLIGPRVDAEPDAARALADQCARLPLALRVAAELATSRNRTTLADLVSELADQQARLEHLDAGGDPRAAVPAVFSWSYRHLPAGAARAFRLLGLHPGTDIDAYAAAALTGTDLPEARRLLNTLAQAHLTQPAAGGRYGMHDLLRAYAAGRARAEDGDGGVRAALTRLFDHYVDTARTTTGDAAAARAWFDAERQTLVAVCAHAAAHGWPDRAIRLAAAMSRPLDTGAHFSEALTVHGQALDAARNTGDRAAEAKALTDLGSVHWRLGRYEPSAEHHRSALAIYREVGDRSGEAHVRSNLARAYDRQGRFAEAADEQQQALALHRQLGDRAGEANALGSLGIVCARLGHDERCVAYLRQALDLYRQTDDPVGQARVLTNLGIVEARLGHYGAAVERHREAYAIAERIGYRVAQAAALTNLGDVEAKVGRHDAAADCHARALDIFREVGDRYGEACALNGLGEAWYAIGRVADALDRHSTALAVASDSGDTGEEARAHTGIARIHRDNGDTAQARQHGKHALSLYRDLGAPEADEVRSLLDAMEAAVAPEGGYAARW